MGATEAAPDADQLFRIYNDRKTQFLLEDQAQNFHHTLEQLMLMIARALQEVHTEVELLTTHVKKSCEEKWGNSNKC